MVLLSLMESITIKVENDLARRIGKSMRPHYSTKTEFIREAIRDKIKEIDKQKMLEALSKNFGKAPVKTTDAENRKVREEIAREIMREFGLE